MYEDYAGCICEPIFRGAWQVSLSGLSRVDLFSVCAGIIQRQGGLQRAQSDKKQM